MRYFIFLFAFFAASASANSEPVSVNESVLKQKEATSTSGFHFLTFKCHLDEGDEIATTPGSPPLDVDDPGTPGCNTWEINIVMDADLTHNENNYELPLFDLNYGIGDNLQLKYEVPYSVSSSQNPNVGDSKFGLKFQFYGNDESRTQMAVYPQLLTKTPGKKSVSETEDTSGTITTLPLLLTKRLARTTRGDIMLTGNIGYNISTRAETQNYLSAALGVGAPLVGRSAILMEVATQQALTVKADEARQQLVKLDLAATTPVNKNFLVFASVGHSLTASDTLNHTYVVSGIRWLPGE